MFNLFRKKSPFTLKDVLNVATSALTGRDLYSFMWRSKRHNVDSSLSLSAVFCALNLYTGSISSLPRTVYRIDVNSGKPDRQLRTDEHPAVKIFLHYANPNYSADQMIVDIVNDRLMWGNYYALREFDSQNRTFRIHYIHPSRIPRGNIFYAEGTELLSTNRQASRGELIYRIETGNTKEDSNPSALLLPREYMFHIQSGIPDKANHRGYGIVENSQRSFNMYENSEEYGVHFFKTGHKSQTFLSTEQRLAPDVLRRIEGIFEENPNQAMAEAFKTRVLEQGLKPINTAIPLEQLQFIQTRAFSVEDIARWFNVPVGLLHSHMGGGKEASSDLSQLIHLFIQTGLHPMLNSIGKQIRNELIPLGNQLQYNFEFNLIYLFRTIINEFSQALRNFFEIGVMDRTAIANLLGMSIDPSDDNNTLRYVPVNLMTVDHSIALRDKALMANDLLSEQIRSAKLANDHFVPPDQQGDSSDAEPESDSQDNSPDNPNIDKRLRVAKNSFRAVIKGLQDYEFKVFNQKKEKYSDAAELKTSMALFHEKFRDTITNAVCEYESFITEVSPFTSVSDVLNTWFSSQYCLTDNAEGHSHFLELLK